MGQKLQDDKIGILSHNTGIITMAASTVIPGYLTIGGQQYRITSNLTRTIATDVSMAANTLYMIYAVISGGSVVLRISSNVNSLGPSGFTSWKLIGSFYSNGLSSVAFGSFVNIDGDPTTEGVSFDPVINNLSGFTNTPQGRWWRKGKYFYTRISLLKNGSGGVGATFSINSIFTLDTSQDPSTSAGSNVNIGHALNFNVDGAAGFDAQIGCTYVSNTYRCINRLSGAVLAATDFSANAELTLNIDYPATDFSNKSIKDL